MDIYVDGACVPNPGKGSWAFVVLNKRAEVEYYENGIFLDVTNNQMEMIAIAKALEFVCKIDHDEITIFSDSTYCVNLCNSATRKIRKNQELIKDLWEIIGAVKLIKEVNFKWCRGHSGIPGNEAADFYANTLLGI